MRDYRQRFIFQGGSYYAIELADAIDALRAERDALKAFSLAMLESWPLGDVDGADLEDHAVKHGLLVPTKRTEPCSEDRCNCAEYYSRDEWADGVVCYRKAEWLKEQKR